MKYVKPGKAPGLAAAGEGAGGEEVSVTIIAYDPDSVTETVVAARDVPAPSPDDTRTTWVSFARVPSPETLADFGERWGLEPLFLEDVLNTGQRPKAEFREHQTFVTLMMPVIAGDDERMVQASLFLGPNFVVSFLEEGLDAFGEITERLRTGGQGRIRIHGAEYLLYALIDAIVDHGYPVLERLGIEFDELEEKIYEGEVDDVDDLHYLRRRLIQLRRGLWPAREVLERLLKHENSPITSKVARYLKDCYDHQMQINEFLDGLRDSAVSLQELHLAMQGQRLNQVMKVLTTVATIFIPLSFFAGLYGMNFNPEASPWNMPELNAYYGYPAFLLFLAGVVALMLWYFRRKDWF